MSTAPTSETAETTEEQQQEEAPAFTPPSSQDELDRIIQSRLARERSKFEDYDDLKAKASKFDELEQANQSELEKAQKAAADAAAERDKLKQQYETTALRAAVETAAAKAGAVNPAQVFALLDRDQLTIGDDGQVSGAEEAVTAFVESNPHFVGSSSTTTQPGLGTQGADGGDKSTPSLEAQISEAQSNQNWPLYHRLKAQLHEQQKAKAA